MLKLNNVKFSDSGKIVSDNPGYDKTLNPGIKTHNYLGKLFANIFGSGTVTVLIDNKKYYLNRGSCYHLLDLNHVDHTKKKQDFLPKLQELFNKMHDGPSSKPQNTDTPSSSSSSSSSIAQPIQPIQPSSSSSSSSSSSIAQPPLKPMNPIHPDKADTIKGWEDRVELLTKQLEDLENLPYQEFAQQLIEKQVKSGMTQEEAEAAVDLYGNLELDQEIYKIKAQRSAAQTTLNQLQR